MSPIHLNPVPQKYKEKITATIMKYSDNEYEVIWSNGNRMEVTDAKAQYTPLDSVIAWLGRSGVAVTVREVNKGLTTVRGM